MSPLPTKGVEKQFFYLETEATMTYRHFASLLVLVMTVALGAVGCATSGDADTQEPMPTGQQTQRTQQEADRMTSGEILYVLQTINKGEISQAQLAMQRSQNPEVQQTAQLIIQDHLALQQRINQVADQTGAQLMETELSRTIADKASKARQDLMELSGEEFDRAFLEKQVTMHEMALQTAREDLLPDAMDPQVTQLLTNASQSLEHHLVTARQNYQNAQDEAIGGGPEEKMEKEGADDELDQEQRGGDDELQY